MTTELFLKNIYNDRLHTGQHDQSNSAHTLIHQFHASMRTKGRTVSQTCT